MLNRKKGPLSSYEFRQQFFECLDVDLPSNRIYAEYRDKLSKEM